MVFNDLKFAMAESYIPRGYQAVTPYLVVKNPEDLIEFAKLVFKAELTESIPDENGNITHAEIKIGDSIVMIGRSREGNAPTSGMMYLYVYVKNTDDTYKKALERGGKSVMKPVDTYYGDRNAGVTDPSGVIWWIATRIEDLSPEELQKRAVEQRRKN